MRLSFFSVAVALALCTVAAAAVTTVAAAPIKYTPAALADQITNLPGLAQQPSFNQFAGYLVVDEAKNRSIFYWYTESQSSPSTDPLIWWSNGGPGCSGLLGFLTEHGPFRVTPSGSPNALELYPYAWNRLANTLYVEAPAGVGFSFSDDASDYTVGDYRTAQDNLKAIQVFLQRFPHLASNDLYISAESYGGHYVPTLAQAILNSGALSSFRGFLLGNPLTDMTENAIYGQAGTLCGHSLASRPTCEAFKKHCIPSQDAQCAQAQGAVVNEAGVLDPYGLDFPNCNSAAKTEKRRMLHTLYQQQQKRHPLAFGTEFKRKIDKLTPGWQYDPCDENEETTYLNRADVRDAIHVNPAVGSWSSCSNILNYNQSDVAVPMEPVYQDILSRGQNLRLAIFSGDDDSICGTLGTQEWMYNLLGSTIVKDWTQWTYTSEEYGADQVAGFFVEFDGISFITVHGAGHMVSDFQPEKGFAVLQGFLAGDFHTHSRNTTNDNQSQKLAKTQRLRLHHTRRSGKQ